MSTHSDSPRSPALRRLKLIAGALLLCAGLWPASEWWEKGLAKPVYDARISPDGCYRVQEFRPFWVLPVFHPQSPPDDPTEIDPSPHWEFPAFFRLYENRTNRMIGESGIYDLVSYGAPLDWGYGRNPEASVGMITIGTMQSDCLAANRAIDDQP